MTTNDNLARLYGHDAATEVDNCGGRIYGLDDDMDNRGACVYGLGDQGTVIHQQATADDTTTPELWRLNEVRSAAVCSHDNLDTIGARIMARHHEVGVVIADNCNGRGNNTSGLAGFDY